MNFLIKLLYKKINTDWHYVAAVGFLWGFTEIVLNLFLRFVLKIDFAGSVLAGIAPFFLYWAYRINGKILSVPVLFFIVSVVKLLSAFLVGLPIAHASIINPVYAYFTQAAIFILFIILMDMNVRNRWIKNIIGGLLTGFLVAIVFPFVRYFTGIPACVVIGTMLPIAVKYAPLTSVFSAFSFILADWIGSLSRVKLVSGNKFSWAMSLAFDTFSFALIIGIILIQF